MTSPTSAGTGPRTKWGDREGRRRDILDAARAQMATGGYLALNVRDIARGAGVSPGTLYQYFSTKEEIFATLYAEAITAHNQRIAPICARADDLEQFLVDVASAYLDLYAAYGRYFTMWRAVIDAGSSDAFPRELGGALRVATLEQADLLRATLRRLAGPGTGRDRPVDEAIAVTFFWTVLNGLGDHVTSERRHLTPFGRDELVAFAARTLAAGLTTGPTAGS
jgi:AcrR family transcriptional regulator